MQAHVRGSLRVRAAVTAAEVTQIYSVQVASGASNTKRTRTQAQSCYCWNDCVCFAVIGPKVLPGGLEQMTLSEGKKKKVKLVTAEFKNAYLCKTLSNESLFGAIFRVLSTL